MDDTDLSLASAEEAGQQGAAEGQAFQPQQLFQEGQLAADRRAQMMPNQGFRVLPGNPALSQFTQADTLRLQQLQQGMSQAQRQVDSGELTPEEGQQYQKMIGGMMAPLAQKQQAAQQQMQQRAIGQALHQSALEATVKLANMKHLADGYPSTVIRDINPLTGSQVEYHQDGMGKIVQTDMRKTQPNSRAEAIIGQEAAAPTQEPAGPEGAGDEAMGGGPAANPPGPTPDDPRHVMTITNGDHVQKFAFNPNGTIETVFDSRPQLTQSGQSGFDSDEVSVAMQHAKQAMEASFGQLPPMPRNPRLQGMWMKGARERENQIKSLASNILQQNFKSRFQQQGQQNAMERSDQALEHGLTKIQATHEARKNHEESYLAHMKALTTKDAAGNPVLPSRDKILKSMKDAESAYSEIHGQPAPAPTQPANIPVPGAAQPNMNQAQSEFINSLK